MQWRIFHIFGKELPIKRNMLTPNKISTVKCSSILSRKKSKSNKSLQSFTFTSKLLCQDKLQRGLYSPTLRETNPVDAAITHESSSKWDFNNYYHPNTWLNSHISILILRIFDWIKKGTFQKFKRSSLHQHHAKSLPTRFFLHIKCHHFLKNFE